MSSSFKSLSRVSRDFPVPVRPLMLALLPICLCACAGGGGGGLSAAGPVVLVDGSDRFADGGAEPTPAPEADPRDPAQGGTPTPGTVPDPVFYETAEYYGGQWRSPLEVTRFSESYARGWTGLGSLVTVADTGVDTTHPDLIPGLMHGRDFTDTGLQDTNGHGTHVAGIVAARRDGFGMHGGAFDADLAIAKVASGWSYDFDLARAAAAWGRDLGSVAVNVSAAYLRDYRLEEKLVRIGEGSYYLDDPYHGVNGFYGMGLAAADWRAALGPGQILVKAAGNNDTDYSAGANQWATATDSQGKLMLNGQMLIVGNWDAVAERITGNRAGNVCTSWRDGACHDAARISDAFLIAPGVNIVSTYPGGGYAAMTGTSMAAPLVAAAAAVLHQTWPHLNGRQLASLLLETANRDIPGYAEHVHGQGLLDMERATRPVGDSGVPTGDTVASEKLALEGGGALADPGAAARAGLSGVMLLDGYDRDFYVDLGHGMVTTDTRRGSAAGIGGLFDGYAGYFADDSHMAFRLPLADGIYMVNGAGHEDGAFLGNRLGGLLGSIVGSTTAYGLVNLDRRADRRGGRIFAQLGGAVTQVERADRPSLLADAAPILSSTASLGGSLPLAGGRVGMVLSQPVQMTRAAMTYRLPVARRLDGGVSYASREIDLSPARRETDIGLFFRHDALHGHLLAESFVEWRHDAPHALAGPVVEAGLRLRAVF
jgi:subtilisin family serine protease